MITSLFSAAIIWMGVSDSRAEVLRRVAESTVVVKVDQGGDDVSQGSGTVVAVSHGYALILTCNHVIVDGVGIEVSSTFGGRKAPAFVERVDPDHDLALLYARIDLLPLPIATVPPALYDAVYLFGAPLGEVGNASEGILTDLGYMLSSRLWYRVTNGFVAPGISGGTATNIYGELIGVPARASKVFPQLGLLVPLADVRGFLDETH